MLDFIGTCKNNQQVCKRQTLTLILVITILKVLTIHRTGFSRQTKMFLYFIDRYERSEFTTMFNELDLPFSPDCLTKAIKLLGLNKSSGPDLYLNEFFMYGKDVLASSILPLFNIIFELGYFPENWSTGYLYIRREVIRLYKRKHCQKP